ncbi:MAG: glycosyl transferase [Prevotella sp.]|nr:glycosyl transferase [Prevotella sp.]
MKTVDRNSFWVRARRHMVIKFSRLISDKKYLEEIFPALVGYPLNLDDPQSFNEKIQWLKLHDRKEIYSKMVDKAEAKKIVASIIGEEYINPTLCLYDRIEDIDFDQLPNQFVLKCTHDSGGIVICNDKTKLDKTAALKKLNYFFHRKYFWYNREWPYKNVKPRILAERYLVDESGWQLKDYKVFCFNGDPKFIEVDYDRYVNHKLNVYDLHWNYIDFYMTSHNDPNVKIEKPKKLDLMLDLCRKISKDITFLRVDFYSIGDKLYFGELTFHPGSGFIQFHPKEYDWKLGEMLNLKN